MPAPSTSADRWLARSHALLGLLLGGFLVLHLDALWPVLDGREAWVRASVDRGSHAGLTAVVLVVLITHGVLGVMRMVRSKGAALSRDDRGMQRIQAISGVLIALFVGYHVAQLWGLQDEPHGSLRASYDALWSSLGKPLPMAAYVLAISLACFHFAHGLSRIALGASPSTAPPTRRLLARVLAGAIGFGLWALWLQVLAQFVIGQRLF